jgi:hypothetical protein
MSEPYKQTTLFSTLSETLDSLEAEGKVTPLVKGKILGVFDGAVDRYFATLRQEEATRKVTPQPTGSKRKRKAVDELPVRVSGNVGNGTYRDVDGVLLFSVRDVKLRGFEGCPEPPRRLRIICVETNEDFDTPQAI